MTLAITEPPTSTYDELVGVWRERCPDLDEFGARIITLADFWRELHVRAATEDEATPGWGFAGRPVFMPEVWMAINVVTAPGAGGRGIGSQLFRELRQLAPAATQRLVTMVFDDDQTSIDVVTHWGFEQYQHAINSRLELTDLPVPQLPDGITVDDVPSLEVPDPEPVDAMLLASQTNPESTEGEPFSLETERRALEGFEQPMAHVLRVDGVPAGIVIGEVNGEVLQIMYTGIDPAFRGRNLGYLLKQHAHRYAAGLGATVSDTNNEASNTGIRHINEKLGYRRTSGMYRFRLLL